MSKKQVLLFVGQDITAQLIMNRVVRSVIEDGIYEPVIYLPKNAYSPRADLPELREFSFYEKTLLNDVVYPYLQQNPSQCAQNLSPQQWHDQFGVSVRIVDNVNAPDFVDEVKQNKDIACALSVRCTQIFHRGIVDAIKGNHALFLNLHSGLLPSYRGVYPTVRRMFDIATGKADGTDYGCTLHKVDPYDKHVKDNGIDTGKIITVKSIPLNPNHSAYQAYVGMADVGARALISALQDIAAGETLTGYPQKNDASSYYTFPTTEEIQEWKDAGIVLVRPEDALSTLVSAFSKAGTPHAKMLEVAIQSAINLRNTQSGIAEQQPSYPIAVRELKVA